MDWIVRVRQGLDTADADYPFLLYGTDWLAFAHLVIAVAFYGPYRDPVRNIWVVEFGMIACAGIVPLALICGPIRGIPFWWTRDRHVLRRLRGRSRCTSYGRGSSAWRR